MTKTKAEVWHDPESESFEIIIFFKGLQQYGAIMIDTYKINPDGIIALMAKEMCDNLITATGKKDLKEETLNE